MSLSGVARSPVTEFSKFSKELDYSLTGVAVDVSSSYLLGLQIPNASQIFPLCLPFDIAIATNFFLMSGSICNPFKIAMKNCLLTTFYSLFFPVPFSPSLSYDFSECEELSSRQTTLS